MRVLGSGLGCVVGVIVLAVSGFLSIGALFAFLGGEPVSAGVLLLVAAFVFGGGLAIAQKLGGGS